MELVLSGNNDFDMKKTKKIEPVPELKCVRKPSAGSNDGMYSVTIPLKYMVEAYKAPAAFFVFNFIGMKGDWDARKTSPKR